MAVVLERNRVASWRAADVSESFHLTEGKSSSSSIQGLTNKEIAGRMNISPNTIRAFIRMVMGKLGVSTRSGIVGIVFRGIYSASYRQRGVDLGFSAIAPLDGVKLWT